MRILLYVPYFDGISHLNKYLHKIVFGLSQKEFEIILLVNYLNHESKLNTKYFEIYNLNIPYKEFDLLKNTNRLKWLYYRIVFNSKVLFKLYDILTKRKIDVVYFLSYEIVSLSFISLFFRIKKSFKTQFVIEIATANFDTDFLKINSFDKLWRFFMKIAIKVFDLVVCPYYTFNSQSHLNLFANQLKFKQSDIFTRLHFIGDARELKVFNNRRTLNKPVTFLYFGTIRSDKGFDVLCRVLNMLTLNKLIYKAYIVGKPLGYDAQAVINKYQLQNNNSVNIHLEFVSEEEIDEYFSKTDFLVLPYNQMYTGSSGPVYESASRGVPIVGSNISEMGILIQKFNLGYLCEVGNSLDLYEKMSFIISNPESVNYFDLASNVYSFAIANSEEKMIERLIHIFLK